MAESESPRSKRCKLLDQRKCIVCQEDSSGKKASNQCKRFRVNYTLFFIRTLLYLFCFKLFVNFVSFLLNATFSRFSILLENARLRMLR